MSICHKDEKGETTQSKQSGGKGERPRHLDVAKEVVEVVVDVDQDKHCADRGEYLDALLTEHPQVGVVVTGGLGLRNIKYQPNADPNMKI